MQFSPWNLLKLFFGQILEKPGVGYWVIFGGSSCLCIWKKCSKNHTLIKWARSSNKYSRMEVPIKIKNKLNSTLCFSVEYNTLNKSQLCRWFVEVAEDAIILCVWVKGRSGSFAQAEASSIFSPTPEHQAPHRRKPKELGTFLTTETLVKSSYKLHSWRQFRCKTARHKLVVCLVFSSSQVKLQSDELLWGGNPSWILGEQSKDVKIKIQREEFGFHSHSLRFQWFQPTH